MLNLTIETQHGDRFVETEDGKCTISDYSALLIQIEEDKTGAKWRHSVTKGRPDGEPITLEDLSKMLHFLADKILDVDGLEAALLKPRKENQR